MRRTAVLTGLCLMLASALLFSANANATGKGPHKRLSCAACHDALPALGAKADFGGGGVEAVCAKCHEQGKASRESAAQNLSAITAVQAVKAHSSFATIPEAMKQQMIQWLSSHNYPPFGDPSVPWSMSCTSCHTMHGAPYPMLLSYNMENGGLCVFCHGGIINVAADWQTATARRVQFGPSHPGLKQADGTEIPAPASPEDNDVVSGTVNFPLTVFTGAHRTTADIAYRISIPGSVFNVRDVNPANHLYWSFGADMVTWDTTLEANNRPFTVTITPYNPVTLVEGQPVTFYVLVRN